MGAGTDICYTLTKIENQAEKIQKKSNLIRLFASHPVFYPTRGKKKGKIPSHLPISEAHRHIYMLLLPIKEKTIPLWLKNSINLLLTQKIRQQ